MPPRGDDDFWAYAHHQKIEERIEPELCYWQPADGLNDDHCPNQTLDHVKVQIEKAGHPVATLFQREKTKIEFSPQEPSSLYVQGQLPSPYSLLYPVSRIGMDI